MTHRHESLVCPRCDTHFGFGTTCPDCYVLLVNDSFVESSREIEPVVVPLTGWRLAAQRTMAVLGELFIALI